MHLKTFKKGVHPKEFKADTASKPIERMPVPAEVIIPLQQHIGAPCTPVVSKGQAVKTGQIIGQSGGFVSSTVHATISGTIKAIEPVAHPAGPNVLSVVIAGDGKDEWFVNGTTQKSWKDLTRDEINNLILSGGVVGLGGAAFPTHVKLNPPKNKSVDTLIINGCECEPYLTADHRTMVEFPDQIVLGIRIMLKALGIQRAIIGIEANKPDAIASMARAVAEYTDFTVQPLKVKYPQGAEKMLIDAILKRRVPTGGLPMDVGVVVQNVGTALAIADAVASYRPLVERVVTVTGDAIKEPKNLIVRIGTTFQNLIDFCGGLTADAAMIIMGGPMMGIAQHSCQVPVVKATSGLLCLKGSSIPENKEYPCIQCGACVSACPMQLVPTRIARYSSRGNWETASSLGVLNCIECGSCAYICPARLPLVHQIRIGKLKVNELKRQQAVAK